MGQLSNYNSYDGDRNTLDAEESVLGHLVLEQGVDFAEALQVVAGDAKVEAQGWEALESITNLGAIVGGCSGLAAMIAIGSGPIGMAMLVAVGGLSAGGSIYLKSLSGTIAEKRRTEWQMHKQHPELRPALLAAFEGGRSLCSILSDYDRLLDYCQDKGIRSTTAEMLGAMRELSSGGDESPKLEPSVRLDQNNRSSVAGSIATEKPLESSAPRSIEALSTSLDDFSQGASLVLGQSGAGKSSLARTLAKQALDRSMDVFYINLNCIEITGFVPSVTVTGSYRDLKPQEVSALVAEAIELLKAFGRSRDSILIIDELAPIVSEPIFKAMRNTLMDALRLQANESSKMGRSIVLFSTVVQEFENKENKGLLNCKICPLILGRDIDHPNKSKQRADMASAQTAVSLSDVSDDDLDNLTGFDGTRALWDGYKWIDIDNFNSFQPIQFTEDLPKEPTFVMPETVANPKTIDTALIPDFAMPPVSQSIAAKPSKTQRRNPVAVAKPSTQTINNVTTSSWEDF